MELTEENRFVSEESRFRWSNYPDSRFMKIILYLKEKLAGLQIQG
jgi:hypothetical protein